MVDIPILNEDYKQTYNWGGTTLWGFNHIYPILKGAVPMSNEMFHEYRYLELQILKAKILLS